MGIAREKALEIQQEHRDKEAAEEKSVRLSMILTSEAPHLWERLQSEVETQVKEFSESLPEAAQLRAFRLNSNNLTAQTPAFPIIKMEILRTLDSHIQCTVTETRSGLAEPVVRTTPPIDYGLNHNEESCFVLGEKYFSPEELAERLMGQVYEFFRPARNATAV